MDNQDTPNFDLGIQRFASTTEEEQNKIMEGRNCKNTARATKSNLKILMDYLFEKNMPKFEDITDDELPGILKSFHSNLRTINGDVYTLQSLKCI